MTATPQLTTDLQKLVLEVEDDLRDRLDADTVRNQSWHEEHKQAMQARRTAMAWTTWRDDRIVQAAVSWVLTTVFVRFAEDNELIAPTWFTGPGERRHHAVEAQQAFFREHPELTDREWIEQSFEHLRSIPATAGLVDDHAALHLISPSGRMATRILESWRRIGDDGTLAHGLGDPELSTRFLGDLYQDLSEHARETFALLQTPEFVEEFILDQTLTPALDERPLEGFKLIDPTCGSGHFLLGAFARFNDLWAQKAPSMGARDRVQKALDSVYGVDINAFAVAVARFRLTIAALQACRERSLDTADAFDIHVETGDSLIHGKAPDMFEGFSDGTGADLFAYATEDQQALREILAPGQYDVVVGNPPYITVKDKTLNERYRELYPMCKGKYAMTVPFMERFFDLARRASSDRPAGWTGQITSNSFVKREFGTKVIEEFLSGLDLRLVIDTSGAYIPGHGTPTLILVGRNDRPQSNVVRAVLGIRGEPGRPQRASQGLVWTSITHHVNDVGYEDSWVSIVDVARQELSSHPWTLTGGAAPATLRSIENSKRENLEEVVYRIGVFGIMGADEAMVLESGSARRAELEDAPMAEVVAGDSIRDYSIMETLPAWFPYGSKHELCPLDDFPGWGRHFWRVRTELGNRATFSRRTYFDEGRPFYEWHQLPKDTGASAMSIVYAEISSHNHFALASGDYVFKRTAPIIKLPADASKIQHLNLVGALNSSIACFWLKQNCYKKGGDPMGPDGARLSQVPWSDRYAFNATTLRDFPLPHESPTEMVRDLHELGRARQIIVNTLLDDAKGLDAEILSTAKDAYGALSRKMVARQEELDWWYYAEYGLLEEAPIGDWCAVPDVQIGQRAFEIYMGRKLGAGQGDESWFKRHGIAPIVEIPLEWPEEYRQVIQRRIELIENDRTIGLLERPEYKRRWVEESWTKRQERALRGWLLDQTESCEHWFDRQGRPAPRSIGQLADALGRDENFVSVLELWAGRRDVDLVAALTKLLADEAVPYLAAWRLKEPALRKWEAWKITWDLQRRQDAGEDVGQIPVPPKYSTADFRMQSYWSHRGKLDIPKERFIVYPEAELSTDRSMLLGWAGWNHAEQFLALASHMDRMTADGAGDDRLVPVLAGLHELLPWVQLWHAELDPAYGVSLGDFAAHEVEQRRSRLGVSFDDLVAWRPPKATHGRRKKAS